MSEGLLKLQLKSDKRWKYVWTVFMNTRPTSKKHEFATKKVSLGPLHWTPILLSETNRTQFTKKCESLYLSPTLLPKTKNQQGWIYKQDIFVNHSTEHPPYFWRPKSTGLQLNLWIFHELPYISPTLLPKARNPETAPSPTTFLSLTFISCTLKGD